MLSNQLRQSSLLLTEQQAAGQRLTVKLFPDGGDDLRVPMPEAEDAEAAQAVEVLVAVGIPHEAPLRLHLDRLEPHEPDQAGQSGVEVLLVACNGLLDQLVRCHAKLLRRRLVAVAAEATDDGAVYAMHLDVSRRRLPAAASRPMV